MAKSILKRLKNEPAPLIDGNVVTFIWQGKNAPGLVGDFTGWDEGQPVQLVQTETEVWTYQLNLAADAYIEYSYIQGGENLADPFNPRVSPNGIGGYNHFFEMPNHHTTELTQKRRKLAHGKVTRHIVSTEYSVFGTQRAVYLYQPPVKEPVPLLVVWDGQDYLNRVQLNIMVDNLISERRIQPLAMALVKNGGAVVRGIEYSCNDSTLLFLMNNVLPLAVENLNLVDIKSLPGSYGVAGASMGGLMALYTAERLPQVFGKVLSQSGAFVVGGMDMVVFDLLKSGQPRNMKTWIDVGLYDLPSLLSGNRRMKNVLGNLGYPLQYSEYHAGHNYPAWRDDIWRGLEWLFGYNG
jgi:enterochelin esterase-like enzyme